MILIFNIYPWCLFLPTTIPETDRRPERRPKFFDQAYAPTIAKIPRSMENIGININNSCAIEGGCWNGNLTYCGAFQRKRLRR